MRRRRCAACSSGRRRSTSTFTLRDGLRVEVRATPSIYEARGEFQLNVDTVRLAGVGALYEQFARLKARLEAAGWFAAERKRPLPAYPRAVGIVTSPRAAALRDVLTTLARRWPALRVIALPDAPSRARAPRPRSRGRSAPPTQRAEVDVLIVARGGGSIEDLWAFNEEIVARAVFESVLPVVSGVGHETDFTICDFVADVRAPTPTARRDARRPRPSRAARSTCGASSRALGTRKRTRCETRAQRLDHAVRAARASGGAARAQRATRSDSRAASTRCAQPA